MADFNSLFDDDYGYEPIENNEGFEEESYNVEETVPQEEKGDLIGDLLKQQGISDPSKIKFEEADGIIKERDWDDLSYQEQLNILSNNDNTYNPETDLDEDEIDIINAIRSSKMTPQQYMDTVKQQAINDYYSQNGNVAPQSYSVDDYTDDELFLYDMQVRMPDMTEEELTLALENAKSNEQVYAKQVAGIRNEYKQLENNKIQQEQAIAKQQQETQYNQMAQKIITAIDSQSDIANTFELEDEDKQMIAYGILGQDQAGISNLSKALNDPQTLVKMMWFALKGEEAIDSINEYYKDQISKARQSGYQKGLQDAQSGNTGSKVVKRQTLNKKPIKSIDDLY